MILSGIDIQKNIHNGSIKIEPYNEQQLNPNSYNLRLHNELITYTQFPLDMRTDNVASRFSIPEHGLLLEPHRLYLGRTVEHTETYGFVPMIEGRSSIGRLGIFIHITAGFGDVGFVGYWTVEISCIHPVIIYPFIEICQIFYHSISSDYQNYGTNKKISKYNNNTDIQTSKMYYEFPKT